MKFSQITTIASVIALGVALGQTIPTKCNDAAKKVCPKGTHTIRNQTGCRDCVRTNIEGLDKECTKPELVAYCEPSSCREALELLCEETLKNETLCDMCVKKELRHLAQYKCDTPDEVAFCKSGYVPPTDPGCEKELDDLCKIEQPDYEKCITCEVENIDALEKKKCDSRDLLTFCKGK